MARELRGRDDIEKLFTYQPPTPEQGRAPEPEGESTLMDWQTAWERDKYEVGRAMHAGWKRQKIANGFADHPFQGEQENWPCDVPKCGKSSHRHHDDMIDWSDLPPEQQALNYSGGEIPFRIGFRAGKAD